MKQSILIARNPKLEPMKLPTDLQSLITHPHQDVRVIAVGKLSELLDGSQYGMDLSARKALEKLAADDSRMVADAAQKVLELI